MSEMTLLQTLNKPGVDPYAPFLPAVAMPKSEKTRRVSDLLTRPLTLLLSLAFMSNCSLMYMSVPFRSL